MEFIILLITPLVAALLSGLIRTKRALIEIGTVIAVCIQIASVGSLVFRVVTQGSAEYSGHLSLNALSALFAIVVALVGFVTALYSVGYIREEMKRGMIGMHRVRQFYALFHIFLFSMFGAVVITNPILMWIAVEATTLSTVFLISFYGKPNTIEAAWKFLIINSIALLLGFLGTVLFVSMPSTFGGIWSLDTAVPLDPALVRIAFIFVLIGYGTKTGFVPLHTWLPDAHGMAPVPISSLLSGALLNVSFFAIVRFKLLTDSALGASFTQQIFLGFGILSVVVAALLIFTQYNYKRLLAYSSIEHMGVMALGFGAGGVGVFASLLHMLYHALTKSLLFLSSGNIILKYGTSKISGVRGLGRALPLTTGIFFIGVLAITGVPPFGIFVTEFTILSSLMAQHAVIAAIALVALALVCVGFFKCLSSMMAGEPPHEDGHGEETVWTIAPLILLVLLLGIISSMVPSALTTLLERASQLFH